MKKIVLLLSVVALVFTSCSKNEDEPAALVVDTGGILIKKIIETNSGGSFTSNFTYNGNKVVNISNSDNTTANYIYTGNLITGAEYYDGTVLFQSDTYTYNVNNKIVTYLRLNYGVNTGNKTEYTYNADGTISFINYYGNLSTQTTVNNSGKIFSLNGEINKVENYVGTTTTLSSSTNYTYDDKNHPFKNILGYNETSFNGGSPKGMIHNFLSRVTSSQTYTFNYTYDTNGFPTNETKTYSGGTATKQYFY